MQKTPIVKAGIFSVAILFCFIIAWEAFWRSQHFVISYNDDEALWAYTRNQIYSCSPSGPVLIGSSRIKFDLDLDTWKNITGEYPIQLAIEGTSPRPVLRDLANDTSFHGFVIVGFTEFLFLSPTGSLAETKATKRIRYYKNWSYSDRVSFQINKILESHLVFLQENTFSFPALLKRLAIKNRDGVAESPNFPIKFISETQFNRQSFLPDQFIRDSSAQEEVRGIWRKYGMKSKPDVTADTLTKILLSVKRDIDKIRNRGGDVFFVRAPSSGAFLENERMIYPKKEYWDHLLAETNSKGIYFSDYPNLSGFKCLDWLHLSHHDAKAYTAELIPILEEKSGWKIIK